MLPLSRIHREEQTYLFAFVRFVPRPTSCPECQTFYGNHRFAAFHNQQDKNGFQAVPDIPPRMMEKNYKNFAARVWRQPAPGSVMPVSMHAMHVTVTKK